LHAWGLSDVVDDAELVVTELATNAIRHGGGRFTLSLSRGPDAVRLVVADPSRQLPESRTVNNELGTGGRGLHIVSTLSRSWGVEIDEGRKAVWAEIPVASSRVV
jgi:anti-sigma regulatory factor (Ser/Thr protein kinase)